MLPLSNLSAERARGLKGLLFDLDDTLLTHGMLTRGAFDALWGLHDAGLRLVAVTGRPSAWGEVLVGQWPIDGAVTENGAVHVVREGRSIVVRERCTKEEREARRTKLRELVARVAEVVPEARLTDDAAGRRSDVTWDIGEHQCLSAERVEQIAVTILHSGARTTRSSVHVHATFDVDDKASGAISFLARVFGEDAGSAVVDYAFIGDSGNDAACFGGFAVTFGVANVKDSLRRIAVPPRYIASLPMGDGFAEVAKTLLGLRAAAPSARPPGISRTGSTSESRLAYEPMSLELSPLKAAPSKPKSDTMPHTNAELAELARRHLYANYRPAPIVLSRGRGCELFDVEGKRWLDLCAGVAVCSIGHAHPRLVRAIAEQAARVMHVSNYFLNEPNVLAAAELCRRTGMDRALFCNSGAEANEAMLKLARRHFYAAGQKKRVRIVSFQGAFHGRSMGALAMTGSPKYREGFGEMPGFTHVAYGDLEAVKAEMHDDVAAINVEPIQGEGGVLPAPPGFLRGLRDLCDASGALLLIDEVQTGAGRAGRFLASDGSGARPDVIAMAKGIGGGFPVGVMLTREKLAGALPPGTHGTTFGGNALASAAVLAVLGVIDDEKLVEGARTKGEQLGAMLGKLARDFPTVCETARGEGLLWGLVLREGLLARDVLPKVLEHGVLLTASSDRVLRFCPPLVVTLAELEEGVLAVRKVLGTLAA